MLDNDFDNTRKALSRIWTFRIAGMREIPMRGRKRFALCPCCKDEELMVLCGQQNLKRKITLFSCNSLRMRNKNSLQCKKQITPSCKQKE
jgi:hypothetical protein